METRKKKIAVITGSRADYGLLCWVMKEIRARENLLLIPFVTGAHLDPKWGGTVSQIRADGFSELIEVPASPADTSRHGICSSMADTITAFSAQFQQHRPDLLLLLGDRFEIMAAAMAALVHNIPIGHIGGGEISEGAIDNSIRHSLSKLSHFHFVISPKCASRLRQLGEEPWRIHVVGSPRLDYIHTHQFKSREELSSKLGIKFEKHLALVIFHPATLDRADAAVQVRELCRAMEDNDLEYFILPPNIDTGSEEVLHELRTHAGKHENSIISPTLDMSYYLAILKHCDLMIGNSSAGIVEAPLFELPVVNVGDRQKGRDCMRNVIHCSNAAADIGRAIRHAIAPGFRPSLKNMGNDYGDGHSSRRIADIISALTLDEINRPKKDCL